MGHETTESELSVGVRLLDCDHREMAEAIMEIQTATDRAMDQSRVSALLRKLAHLTMTHFALEEATMSATKYPRLALHQIHHQKLMEQLRQVVADQNRSKQTLSGEWIGALADWHHLHVRHEDGQYGDWLNRTPSH